VATHHRREAAHPECAPEAACLRLQLHLWAAREAVVAPQQGVLLCNLPPLAVHRETAPPFLVLQAAPEKVVERQNLSPLGAALGACAGPQVAQHHTNRLLALMDAPPVGLRLPEVGTATPEATTEIVNCRRAVQRWVLMAVPGGTVGDMDPPGNLSRDHPRVDVHPAIVVECQLQFHVLHVVGLPVVATVVIKPAPAVKMEVVKLPIQHVPVLVVKQAKVVA